MNFSASHSKKHLPRKRLLNKIESGLTNGNVVIQAMSGYGKSTLISTFLQKSKTSYLLLNFTLHHKSLKSVLNDLLYGSYDAKTFFPSTLKSISSFQEERAIEDVFRDELTGINSNLLVVIDDLHIANNVVVDYFFGLVDLNPKVKYIFSSRINHLESQDWKYLSKFTIIDQNDLKFTNDEFELIKIKLQKEALISPVYAEGWIVGIHMSSYGYLNGSNDTSSKLIINALAKFRNNEEIVLLSELNGFNAAFCANVLKDADLITKLKASPLIIVPEGTGSFRFHHFIQESLDSLREGVPEDKVVLFKQRCLAYFKESNQYTEAFQMALELGMKQESIQLFEFLKINCFNKSNTLLLKKVLELAFDHDILSDQNIRLTKAWLRVMNGDVQNINNDLSAIHIDSLEESLKTEYFALKSYGVYVTQDYPQCVELSRTTRTFQSENQFAIGYSFIFELGSIYALKGEKVAFALADKYLKEHHDSIVRSMILLVLCYLSRFCASLDKQYNFASSLLKLGELHENQESVANAYVFLGEYYLQTQQIKKASSTLKKAYEHRGFAIGAIRMSVITLFAKVLFITGKIKSAYEVLENEVHLLNIEGNAFIKQFFIGTKAELQLSSNDKRSIEQISNIEFPPFIPASEVCFPLISKILVQLKYSNSNEHNDVYTELRQLQQIFLNAKNKRYLGYTFLLESLLKFEQKETTEALDKLNLANTYTPFDKYKFDISFLSQSFPSYGLFVTESLNLKQDIDVREKLSKREIMVLKHYEKALSNQDIADYLGISVATVKRHNANIFNKLNVNSKQQAWEHYQG